MAPVTDIRSAAWRALAELAAAHAAAPGLETRELSRAAFRVAARGAPQGGASADRPMFDALEHLARAFAFGDLSRRLRLAAALRAVADEAAAVLEPPPAPLQAASASAGGPAPPLFPPPAARPRADLDGPFTDGDDA